MNQAMLAKASWRIMQKDDGLWSRIYKHKYLAQDARIQNFKKNGACSSTWSSIIHGAALLQKGLRWRIGNGRIVNFWGDIWTDYGRLVDHFIGNDILDLTAVVRDFWVCQTWNMTKLRLQLPPKIVESIHAIPISNTEEEDKIIWNATDDGVFSVKTAYLLAVDEEVPNDSPWPGIWALQVPPKLKIFLWTMMAGKLMTNSQRVIRHLTSIADCPHCPGSAENLLHLFRECPKAKLVWNSFSLPALMRNTFVLDWKGWTHANLLQKSFNFHGVAWNVFFTFICWYLWNWRCRSVFDSSFRFPFDRRKITCSYIEEWVRASRKSQTNSEMHSIMLQWTKPPENFLKLNVDGAKCKRGFIGAGGVIRDRRGSWVRGFMSNMGSGEALQAEAWGLFHGLKMARDLGVGKIIIESDSAMLINLIKEADITMHPLGIIVENCRGMMLDFDEAVIKHVFREQNIVADQLAKGSLGMERGCCVMEEAPCLVTEAMLDDCVGSGRLRRLRIAPHHCCSSNAG